MPKIFDYRNSGELMHLRDKPSRFDWARADDSGLDMMQECCDTLYQMVRDDPKAAGLAANQIGYNLPVFVAKHNGLIYTFINPVIVKRQGKVKSVEGCLSIPDRRICVNRARKVAVEYHTDNGANRTMTYDGDLALIIQHEMDHLNGVLMIDYEAQS